MEVSVSEIAKLVGGKVIGNDSVLISSVGKIESATANEIAFLSNKKYVNHLQTTNAGVILVDETFENIPENKTVILCKMPYVAFCTVLITYFDYKNTYIGIHPTAVVEDSASIGQNVYIGPNVYIGQNVIVEDNSKIYANSSIYESCKIGHSTIIYSNVSLYYNSIVGNKCIIHSGTVIGSDGFGHAPLPDGTYIKIPQIGNVIIKDNVEIGSNCSIDRANMGSTIIEEGARLDNLVQIAHGVQIGKHTIVAAQAGISGSTIVGNHVVIAGQVGVVGHITIADKVQIGAQSGVSNHIKEVGGKFTDSPHIPLANAFRSRVLYRNLPEMDKRIQELERKIELLSKK